MKRQIALIAFVALLCSVAAQSWDGAGWDTGATETGTYTGNKTITGNMKVTGSLDVDTLPFYIGSLVTVHTSGSIETAGNMKVSGSADVDGSFNFGAISTTSTGAMSGVSTLATTNDVTIASDATGGNAGARNQFQGLAKLDLVTLGTMTNGATETTAYIDADPTGEWSEVDAGTNVLVTADTTYYRDVTNSLKVAYLATAVAGDGVTRAITGDDMTNNESIGMWVYSTVSLTAGDVALTLDDDDAATDFVVSVPAVAANIWTWVEMSIASCEGGGTDCNAVSALKLLLTTQGATNQGAVNIYYDAAYKWDLDDEETVSRDLVQDGVLSCLTVGTANTAAHTQTKLVEYTDYITHYQSGNDAIVILTDQSANSGTCMVAYQ